MRWEIYNDQDELVNTAYDSDDAEEMCEQQGDGSYMREVIPCKGCDEEGELMHDAYGIPTGHWCATCYDSPKYPYRKEAYDYEACGERLEDDY